MTDMHMAYGAGNGNARGVGCIRSVFPTDIYLDIACSGKRESLELFSTLKKVILGVPT